MFVQAKLFGTIGFMCGAILKRTVQFFAFQMQVVEQIIKKEEKAYKIIRIII